MVSITHTDRLSDLPLAHTRATRMLAAALEARPDLSQRSLALALHYKSSVVISHMASGRAPIPIERVPDIATALDIDQGAFLQAVLEQRYPSIDFRGLLSGSPKADIAAPDSPDGELLRSLELIAGDKLHRLPADKLAVVREVLSDRRPDRRWLTLNELPLVEELREVLPRWKTSGVAQTVVAAIKRAALAKA